MKKIVIFYPHISEYGGIERNIIAIAENLVVKGLIPFLVCYYDRIGMHKFNSDLKVIELKDHWNPLIKAFRLKKWLKNNSKEIIGLPLFFGSKSGFYAAMVNITPYALHYTDPPSLLTSNIAQSKFRKLLWAPRKWASDKLIKHGVDKAKRCITMTHWNIHELKKLYGRDFHVIHQGGTPPKRPYKEVSVKCSGRVLQIFSICRLSSSKNLDWIIDTTKFLQSTALINQWYESVRVIIAGTGPQMNYLIELSEKLGVKDIVHFPGFLSEDDVEIEYYKTDLFLVPARQGYGLPVLEALYRGIPVVLNSESRVSEILTSNPWAAISDNSCSSFKKVVLNHIFNLRNNYPHGDKLEHLPTEKLWSEKIADYCNWL